MDTASAARTPSAPWQVVAGIAVAALGIVAAFGMVGAMTGLRVVLSLGEPEQDALLGTALLLLASAALAVAAIVAAIRGRGWSRPALLGVAVATVVAALLVDQAWIGSVPIALGALLLWLGPSRRWFADRAASRAGRRPGADGPPPRE